jgi:hypothetical protein
MFGRIDCNNADWGVLFGHPISDSGFDVPLTERCAPIVTEAIDDKIHLMITFRLD